ncbi:UDP-glucose dehydrogenase family protein [Bacillus sp. FJAT-45037]|uniref:UDP-glucose dehydrogenase family protein n=1 Tax=Bacillus sp. FJAT-45037 TaxID=2011007 RepID=UPI000C24B69E|nr:UDP-glucose/GDP-mannose dehydrogenase family protein [Bacillus sp. FJAT-45037]
MNITVVGTGYVGLVTGIAFAEVGHEVICLDVDEIKVAKLRQGNTPIYEPGLESYLIRNIEANRLAFTTVPTQAFAEADVIFIAVGTPERKDGSADLSYIEAACRTVAEEIRHSTVVVIKSTVPVGTNECLETMMNTISLHSIHVVSVPEFLREGQALSDTFQADRIVIGAQDAHSSELVRSIYEPFERPIFLTDRRSAELIKYGANAFLATKISFINEIANLCDELGANVDDVASGMGMDQRIGRSFLRAGIGYGGSCFPKDTKALVQIAGDVTHDFKLLKSVIEVNNTQRHRLVAMAKAHFGSLIGLRVAVLGLSFKPNTDDMREAASLVIIDELLESGAHVVAYDPVAQSQAKRILSPTVEYANSVTEAIDQADACLLVTEWDEIVDTPVDVYCKLMKNPVLFDGRNCYSLDEVKQSTLTYYSIGRNDIIHAYT